MAVIESYHSSSLEALCSAVRQVLQRSGLVAIPTETFYGLGVNPFDAGAVARLGQVKGRPDGKPILLLIGAREQLADLVASIPPVAAVLMDAFWPGPLTLVLPARAGFPELITAGTGTVGVRWTSSPALREILERVGPLTGTSANRSGHAPVRTAREVRDTLGDQIDMIVDAGPTAGGLPSTVVDVQEPVRIIREGAIDRAAVQQALRVRGFSLNVS